MFLPNQNGYQAGIENLGTLSISSSDNNSLVLFLAKQQHTVGWCLISVKRWTSRYLNENSNFPVESHSDMTPNFLRIYCTTNVQLLVLKNFLKDIASIKNLVSSAVLTFLRLLCYFIFSCLNNHFCGVQSSFFLFFFLSKMYTVQKEEVTQSIFIDVIWILSSAQFQSCRLIFFFRRLRR